MSTRMVAGGYRVSHGMLAASSPGFTLAAALLGFFVVTLDATVVNVALPSVRADFGGGISGLQWVVDGYTLMFAALLLSAGALADRIGARRAFGAGVAGFVLASVALVLLARISPSPRRPAPFDWAGQVTAVLAMGGLTYGAIEAGATGLAAPRVLAAFTVAVAGLAVFLAVQARGAHPMMPLDLLRSRTAVIANVVGFAFIVGYYGLPFVMSLYLQQVRGLAALGAGAAFVPMMLTGAALTPFSARLAEKLGARRLIIIGLVLMTAGLVAIAVLAPAAPAWGLALLMILTGLGGPLVMPPMTAVLLNSVPGHRAGTASGIFNTSRQVGGALAVAVFGTLLASRAGFLTGLRVSLLIAAAIALGAAAISTHLAPATRIEKGVTR